ncbi:MAG: YggS family pyridoxal phosphate-dependent enzyme [Verrucomicrobia bacterium]|nr:YggS family pyridoxal phosphate-dependent enzyme [Verrucomicrobiota bacterium]MDE3098889.1 YggS family pyridoxal phosphate-dependent enzyme [Verrucomicrobiota bacterium]
MSLATNLAVIQYRIREACKRAGRSPESVLLLAVSKTHPPQAVEEAVVGGQIFFGESKVQEAKQKIPLCPGAARWHFIGHLQSNKVRDAAILFEMIESVDSPALAREISKRCQQAARTMPILLQVNVAGESSKFGCSPERLPDYVTQIATLPAIEIHGLMTLPPYAPDPEKSRRYFRRLRELKGRCEEIIGAPLAHLSMGMSDDFEIAIEEGATIVRVGTALFGRRIRSSPPAPEN